MSTCYKLKSTKKIVLLALLLSEVTLGFKNCLTPGWHSFSKVFTYFWSKPTLYLSNYFIYLVDELKIAIETIN